jgi:hypothetical protein
MTNPIQKLDLDTIEQSQIARIAGINLTLGGLVSAGVILLIAFAAHWLVTRSLRRVRERSDRSRQAICWSGWPATASSRWASCRPCRRQG